MLINDNSKKVFRNDVRGTSLISKYSKMSKIYSSYFLQNI